MRKESIVRKNIKLVVVDNNLEVTNSIKRYFKDSNRVEIVSVFDDGANAINFFVEHEKEYDTIVMDLLLPHFDAISILQTLRNRGIKKHVIILSSFKDDYSVKKLVNLGIDYYILKPFSVDSLKDRLYDLSEDVIEENSNAQKNIEVRISEILHDLGIPSSLKGFYYIRDSILLILRSNNFINYITKEIYPRIAEDYNTTSSRVERAIRNAIEVSWDRGNDDLVNELFGSSICYERGKPTNAEFLNTVADRIRLITSVVVR